MPMVTTQNRNEAARLHEEHGGWLLDLGGVFLVTDDPGIVADMRGEEYLHQTEAAGRFDETAGQ